MCLSSSNIHHCFHTKQGWPSLCPAALGRPEHRWNLDHNNIFYCFFFYIREHKYPFPFPTPKEQTFPTVDLWTKAPPK